jgi:hypothetical protein
MARAQELQEWDWDMENGHGGTTHIFVMVGLHVKQPVFYLLITRSISMMVVLGANTVF